MEIVNIAAYKFVEVPEPRAWRQLVRTRCQQLGVMGSILLAPEGINLFVAAERESIEAFTQYLRHDELFGARFADIGVKESISDHQHYKRIVVRIKDEIIAMKRPVSSPAVNRAPSVQPSVLRKWLDQGHDDAGREIVMLDTRNNFEVQIGTFAGAVDFGIEKFSQFPQAFADTEPHVKPYLQDKTIVSFCTGGIRCEKAALFLSELNVANVLQLDGGILRYFEEEGGAHWQGECFVFDRRVALDSTLQPTKLNYEVTAEPQRNNRFLEYKSRKSELQEES